MASATKIQLPFSLTKRIISIITNLTLVDFVPRRCSLGLYARFMFTNVHSRANDAHKGLGYGAWRSNLPKSN